MLLENPGQGGTLNHLGVEVPASEDVHAAIARLTEEGLFTAEEIGTTCCFATQDKVWVTGPAGERWEVYTVLADSETFGSSPQVDTGQAGGVCGVAMRSSKMRSYTFLVSSSELTLSTRST